MRCLYCNKEIRGNASEHERENRWHAGCIKKFFGTNRMPVIDVTKQRLEELANETINKGLTVPGVQKKLSLHLSTEEEARLTIVDYPTGYILKPQTDEYEMLPEFEYLAMSLAALAGVKVVPYALIKNNDTFAYITRRIDRNVQQENMKMYAMEDFCQLAERLTIDKYKGSYEKCAKIIKNHSERAGLDLTELFLRIVVSFIIGNSDMHLKNFSLIENSPGSRAFHLSPAYDMLPVNIVLPEDTEQMALTLNGKKSNFKKRDFLSFAEVCGIPDMAAENMIKKVCSLEKKMHFLCDESYLSDPFKGAMKELITERIQVLA